MTTPHDEFTSATTALGAVSDILAELSDDDMRRPTPCPDYDVSALLRHLTDTIARLGAAAGINSTEYPGATPREHLEALTDHVITCWRTRGTHGKVFFSGRALPDPLALGILSLELVVHGWDLSVALNHPITITDAHAAFVLNRAHQTLTPQSRAVAGFDPPITVCGGTVLDKLVRFTGRNPDQWHTRHLQLKTPRATTSAADPG